MSRDPIYYEGGDNLYAYVMGNPVRYLDPSGLDVEMCVRPLKKVPTWFPDWDRMPKHCFLKFNKDKNDTLGFDPGGVGPDTSDHTPSCHAANGGPDDACVKKAMNDCQAVEYDPIKFNCCHCAERALNKCSLHVPRSHWPN